MALVAGEKPSPRPPDDPTLPPTTVLEVLARIVASGSFRASARRKRLLGFLVEETVAGRADRLKPYAIAVDALGCDETFDPQTDPIVRLEVGRLRRDLEHYYLTDGRDDPVRITIPKSGSVPAFERWGGGGACLASASGQVCALAPSLYFLPFILDAAAVAGRGVVRIADDALVVPLLGVHAACVATGALRGIGGARSGTLVGVAGGEGRAGQAEDDAGEPSDGERRPLLPVRERELSNVCRCR